MKKLLLSAVVIALLIIAATPIRAYVTAKSRAADGSIVVHKWSTASFPVTYEMYPVQGTNLIGSRTQAEVMNQAFQAWQSVVPVSLKQGSDAAATARVPQQDNHNVITTNSSSSDLPAGVLGLTYTFYTDAGQIVEADMAFSGSFTFSTSPGAVASQVDLQAVATHEAGHFLGMDHASNLSSTMFWATAPGFIYQRNLSSDDIAGISTLYPPATFASKGTLTGTVRSTAGVPVYGAIVVAVNAGGSPVASAVTDPQGVYSIQGLDQGSYTVYAEPLSGRISASNIGSLQVFPGSTVNTAFTTRYH